MKLKKEILNPIIQIALVSIKFFILSYFFLHKIGSIRSMYLA